MRRNSKQRRAVFLDRDGTLNEEAGYITDPAQFRLFACAAEAVRLINAAGWLAIVLTNQSGIARGLFTEDFLAQLHKQMRDELQRQGARVDAVYACPHLPEQECERGKREEALSRYRVACDCRKPQPGLIKRAAADFELELARSFVVGDRYRDVEMGHAAGAQSALVLTGYGRVEYEQRAQWPRQPELVAADLLVAVQAILSL